MSRKLVTALTLTVALGAVAISASPSHAGGCFRGGCYTSVAYARPYIYHNPVVFANLPREHLASAPSGSTITLPSSNQPMLRSTQNGDVRRSWQMQDPWRWFKALS